MVELIASSIKLTNGTNLSFKRYLFNTINWDGRLVEITGARGVGKTTLMLQKAKLLNLESPNQALYVSLDDPFFYRNTIIDLADDFEKSGGRYLFMDEVHRYPSKYLGHDWSAELKNVYDRYADLKVVYSGSSILKIYTGKGDLSRRKLSYKLNGMSFREFIELNSKIKFSTVSIAQILNHHTNIAADIISGLKIVPLFKTYLSSGYYPFYYEAPEQFYQRLKDVISVILETDIPSVAVVPFETSIKLKKLLAVITESVPFTPNLAQIARELFIKDQRTLLKYLNFLDQAELINVLGKEAYGNQILRKPDKIYLDNTNLHYCFSDNPNMGTVRETFFANQLKQVSKLAYPKQGDFLVDDRFTFEIGGKNKKQKQIANLSNAFLALDDVEIGFDKSIPLWLFGFLY